jgi:hypothetical protein
MASKLIRHHGRGHLHFITFSCYRPSGGKPKLSDPSKNREGSGTRQFKPASKALPPASFFVTRGKSNLKVQRRCLRGFCEIGYISIPTAPTNLMRSILVS